MASGRKVQKETDQAIKHLRQFIEASDEWSSAFDVLQEEIVTPVAAQCDMNYQQAMMQLMSGPYEGSTFGFLFEELVTSPWGDDGDKPINAFLKQRGWREGVHGKRYLKALAKSSVQIWMVTAVELGEWVDVRLFGTDNKPKRVYEKTATQNIPIGACLATRVLSIDKKRIFSGAILPLTIDHAKRINEQIAVMRNMLNEAYEKLPANSNLNALDLVDDIQYAENELRVRVAFGLWASSVLSAPSRPQMRNTDDEEIVLSTHRFLIVGEEDILIQRLDEQFEAGEREWVWENESGYVLAQIRIKQRWLELETNSVERSNKGVAMLQSLLGQLIGSPIGVHTNLQAAMEDVSSQPLSLLSDEDLQNNPEVVAKIQAHLNQYYKKTLDEPIPILDNFTPRECAADENLREKVILWLRDLELSNKKSGQAFDTTWMWEELQLNEHRIP